MRVQPVCADTWTHLGRLGADDKLHLCAFSIVYVTLTIWKGFCTDQNHIKSLLEAEATPSCLSLRFRNVCVCVCIC